MKNCLVALFVLPYVVSGQTFDEAIQQSRQEINTILTEYPGVSVAVGYQDRIVWSEGFGYADAEAGTKVSADHRFLYYSLSKSNVGLAIYQLVQEGKIDLDKPVTAYDPDLPETYQEVTVRTLLNHSAGVRHYNKGEWMKISMDNCQSPKQALETFIDDPLIGTPGQAHRYSSFGYVLLSHLLEIVTDQPFDAFIADNVFAPRSVNRIERTQGPDLMDLQVTRYQKWNSKKESGKEIIVDNSCKFGGGGFIGTAAGLASLHMQVLQEEKAKPTAKLYESLNPEIRWYTHGLGVNTTDTGDTYYIHTGSGGGGSAILLIYPDSDLTIVILGNINGDGVKNIVGNVGYHFLAALE